MGLTLRPAGCGRATPSSDGGPATLKLTSSKNGRVLVDGRGHTLYLFEKAADASTPGRTKGEDIRQFGAGWYLVDAAGKPVEPGSGFGSNSRSGSSGGGGGYR